MAQFTEEVPEAVETLRCPTCLGLLLDSEVERCPACNTRFRKGTRPISLGGSNGMSGRAHPLFERELEARLEAKTAAGYRQRRRAAKVARRIAALPPTLFESGGVFRGEPDPPASHPPEGGPIIIDLPDEAIHETTSVAPVPDAPADVLVDVPEEVPAEAVLEDPVEVVVEVPVEVVVEVPVEVVVEDPVEAVVEPVPDAPKPRRKRKKAAAHVDEAPDARVDEEPVVEPIVVEPEPVEVVEVVEPVVVAPAPAPVAEVVEVVEPVGEPVADVAPVAPSGWQPSNSLWRDRVFNSVPSRAQNEKVQWPRQWKPVAPMPELDADSVDELTAESPN